MFKKRKRGRKAGPHFSIMSGMLHTKKAEKGAEKGAGRAYYDSIHGMMGMFSLFRKMSNLMQECCHKNFYILENARYNQGKQGQECCHKRKAKCRKGVIMLLLLLILFDLAEIRQIDREIEAIRTDEWWK